MNNTITTIPKTIKPANQKIIEMIETPNFLNTLKRDINHITTSIEQERFTANAKSAFNNLKKLTSYNKFNKKDGSIISEALNPDNQVI